MKITIQVTRNHINEGIQRTSTQCAFAQAVKDADEDFAFPRITTEKIAFSNMRTGERFTVETPEKVAEFIRTWDKDPREAKPFRITLDLDEAVVRPIRHQPASERIKAAERIRGLRAKSAREGVPYSRRYGT